MWHGKCVQVVEFSNGLIRDMSLKLRDSFDDMTLDNTPPVVFNFTIFCGIMIKDLQDDLELLKKAQTNDSG